MKKALLFLGVALAFGLSFMNTNNQENKNLLLQGLSSVVLQANAQSEGCLYRPGDLYGKCSKLSNGDYVCVYYPSSECTPNF